MIDFKDKKLLILGASSLLVEVVCYAQSLGAYVIAADYVAGNIAKQYADESWDISTADLNELANRCNDQGVKGVFAAFDDFNIRMAARLSEVCDIPFYTSSELANRVMDKSQFKADLQAGGVPVTKRVSAEQVVNGEMFPVIVKPTDSYGSKGITVCHNATELFSAIRRAEEHSPTGEIIIEKYYEGDEVGVNYFLANGAIAATAMHDRYLEETGFSAVKLPLAYVYPSKYLDKYLKDEDRAVKGALLGLGLRNGSLFMQGCVQNGRVHFYEAGYRLNAAKQYQIIDHACGFNPMHELVHFSLNGGYARKDALGSINPKFERYYCTLSLLINKGEVARVEGLDVIKTAPFVISTTQWRFPGDVIDDSILGTQKQIAARVTLFAGSLKELANSILYIYEKFKVFDTLGVNINGESFDTSRLF